MTAHRIGPETERLKLRAYAADDAEAFFRLNGDPRVMRHTGEPMCPDVATARSAIEAYPDFDTHGYGRWACESIDSGDLIGFAGLKYLDDLHEVDLGYRFLPEYWGKGLATEASLACIHFGFEVLGLRSIIGLVLPDNTASIRVLEKIGMRHVGAIDIDGAQAEKYVIEAHP